MSSLNDLNKLKEENARLQAELTDLKNKFELEQNTRNFILDSLPIATFSWNSEYEIISWSNSAEKIFEYNESEVIGKKLTDLLIHESHVPLIKQILVKTLESELPQAGSNMNKTKSGKIITCRWFNLPVTQNSEKHIVSYALDITQYVDVEASLKEKNIAYTQIFDHSPYGMIHINRMGEVIGNNEAVCEIFSIPNDELRKINFTTSPMLPESVRGAFLSALVGIPYSYEGEHKFNGVTKYIKSNILPIISKESLPGSCVAFIEDITVRKIMENELIMSKQKAEAADNQKTNFLANMSHEIRTPMNGILGFAELLKDPNLNDKKKLEYIERINDCGSHLLRLLNDIIDISKIEANKITIIERECSLGILFFELFIFFQAELKRYDKPHVELKMQKNINETKSTIVTDPTRLRQILTNLLGNAVKFTNSGSIEFGYMPGENNSILFYVKDTGIGLPTDKKDFIFDRFSQVDASATRKFGGAGLGLAISRGLVELMGGQIWVEPNIEKGSGFYFTLPYKAVKQKSAVPGEVQNDKTDYKWTSKTILVVEDDDTSFEYLEEILRRYKVKIVHVKSGEKAVEICKNNKQINLVLMDIQIQDLNGLDATKLIKANRPDLPVIAQTANAMEEDSKKCKKAGCDDYIAKPIDKFELLKKLSIFLNSPAL